MRAIDQAKRARHTRPGEHGRLWVHTTGELCHDREFLVATDLDKKKKKKEPRDLGRHLIEDFYVTVELAKTKSSASHNRAGRAKARAHDSVEPCCVTIEEAMCT